MPAAPPPSRRPHVKFATTAGDFVVEVYPDKAPKTVENFLRYVNDKHYDGTIFHRVINNFMIQGGGYDSALCAKADPAAGAARRPRGAGTMADRAGHVVAPSRWRARAIPNSATAQFFINVKDNAFLDPSAHSYGYTVFGKVVSGMDVIDKIKAMPTGAGGPFPTDVPRHARRDQVRDGRQGKMIRALAMTRVHSLQLIKGFS